LKAARIIGFDETAQPFMDDVSDPHD